ncbi:MAG: ComEA family DNA-binding protein [Chloroflexota bacterium]
MAGAGASFDWRWPLSALVGLLLIGTTALLWPRSSPAPLQIVNPTPVPGSLKVYVSGAIARPGVYPFDEGERVDDALRAAGGATEAADLDRVNLSTRLRDQLHVVVPARAVAPAPLAAAGAAPSSANALVNLNTATAAQLDTLPGLGPVTVQKIVDHRERNAPFQRIEELLELKIVGASTFEGIKGRITAP